MQEAERENAVMLFQGRVVTAYKQQKGLTRISRRPDRAERKVGLRKMWMDAEALCQGGWRVHRLTRLGASTRN